MYDDQDYGSELYDMKEVTFEVISHTGVFGYSRCQTAWSQGEKPGFGIGHPFPTAGTPPDD
jgi:hypothetical protein